MAEEKLSLDGHGGEEPELTPEKRQEYFRVVGAMHLLSRLEELIEMFGPNLDLNSVARDPGLRLWKQNNTPVLKLAAMADAKHTLAELVPGRHEAVSDEAIDATFFTLESGLDGIAAHIHNIRQPK